MTTTSQSSGQHNYSADPDAMTWVGDYPVVRNKTVGISLLAVSTISVGLAGMLLVGLAVHEGNYEFVPGLLKFIAGMWLGFTILLFLVGVVFFGGKVPMEVTIDDRGVLQIMRSKRARIANWLAIVAGLAGGGRGATAAGAGILAQSRQVEGFGYHDLEEAKGNPKTGEIRLWDDWHTVMQIFVPLDRYDEAIRRIEAGIARSASRRKARTDIPVAAKAWVILGAILCGGFLLVDFPLGFSFLFVIPTVVLTVATILSKPPRRQVLGWILAGAVVASVAFLFRSRPPALYQEGAGLVLGVQMGFIGLFVVFGISAGLGVFNLKTVSTGS